MGTSALFLRAVLDALGIDVILPPETGPATVSLGVLHSPECACFPLKINLGNYLEAARLGADTVVMVGGVGPCRLGYYAEVQREVLEDLGVELGMIVLEPPSRGVRQLLRSVGQLTGGRSWADIWRAIRLGWHKLLFYDEFEALAYHLRPREERRGAVTRALRRAEQWVDGAAGHAAVEEAGRAGLDLLVSVPHDPELKPVRVGAIGEIFMVLEPAVNFGCLETLGELGAEVDRAPWVSGWVREHLLPPPFRPKGRASERYFRSLASSYIGFSVGGEGQQNVGHTIDYARRGFDGVLHIAPFTCMPEIVARTALDSVSKDYGIPVLTFFLDEHAAETGVRTRLEAFVDLLERRRLRCEG
jgi:predicted nucleotide-binding protein (sugar kinase/HSP70/actin superfamily)